MKLSSLLSGIASFVFAVLFYFMATVPVSAATLTVNEYTDGPESGNTSGTCNLREAIQAVNDAADIVGDCVGVGTYGTADEIQFTGSFPQTYTLTWDAGAGTAHPLILDKDLTITGPGSSDLTINGNNEASPFFLGKEFTGVGITFDLSGVTLEDGNGTAGFTYGYNQGDGGSIFSQPGSDITLDDVIMTNGAAAAGGHLYIADNSTATINDTQILSGYAFGNRGGGIYAGTASSVTITNSVIDGNTTETQSGGGIFSDAVLLEIRNSTISNNVTDLNNSDFAQGGGILADTQANSELIIVDSRIINNFAPDSGGGIFSDASSVYIDGVEVSGNTADISGGGVKIGPSNAVVINSTISGNHAGAQGGGIHLVGTPFVYFIHDTITSNTVTNQTRSAGIFFNNDATAHFIGTILAENNTTGDNDDCFTFANPTITSGGYNVIGVNDGCAAFFTADPNDNVGTSASPVTADLGALADNDGPGAPLTSPQTHEATVASTNVWEIIPAATCSETFNTANYGAGGSIVDTTATPFGTNVTAEFAAITAVDQRDYPRPGMVDCEVGSYENSVLATYDYGDAPDSYGTLSASTGAVHTIDASLLLGASVDDEADGQPGAGADNDDNNGATPDDEDGVTFPALSETVAANITVDVINTTGGNGFLEGWIDFDNNGTFDAGEQIATDVSANTSGTKNIAVTPPAGSAGPRYARFRITSTAATGATGDGGIGEVEDYLITISAAPPAPTPTPPVTSSGGGGGGSAGSGSCVNISCFTEIQENEDGQIEDPEDGQEEDGQEEENMESCLGYDENRPLVFDDVPETLTQARLINILKNTKILAQKQYVLSGNGTHSAGEWLGAEVVSFLPFQDATRLEVVKTALIANCIPIVEEIPAGVKLPFKDIDITSEDEGEQYAARIVYTAYAHKVLSGYEDSTARPSAPATLAEILAINLRAANIVTNDGESEWYQPYLDYGGTDVSEAFNPVERAQLIEVLIQMMQETKSHPDIPGYINSILQKEGL